MPEVEVLVAGLFVAMVMTLGHYAGRSISRYALVRGHTAHMLWPAWVRLPASAALCCLVVVGLYSGLNAGLTGRVCSETLSYNVSLTIVVGLFMTGFCGGFFQRPRK